jgi:hypothetical protein
MLKRTTTWAHDPVYQHLQLNPAYFANTVERAFFPMVDEDEGWPRFARNLKAEIDSELVEKYSRECEQQVSLKPTV